MLRRNFLKTAGILAAAPAIKEIPVALHATATSKQIYEWRIYTLHKEGNKLDRFYENTLIPAYNRQGIQVGVFSLHNKEEQEKRFYLFAYPDLPTFHILKNKIWEDNVFTEAAQPFYDETAPDPVYSNYETFLSEVFDKIPQMRMPDKDRGLFELRLYHSPNEEANRRKIAMFNIEEIDLFDKVGINSVFYGDILAGPRMPALLYLTWYKDPAAREEAWSKFGQHPDWNAMKDKPRYAYTATDNTSTLLSPLSYSQI